MSKLGLVIVLILMAGKNNAQDYTASANPQQDYFVLIQADNNQAFYVRLDSQLYTSSPAGHLILSQLKDSAYAITIGFPGQAFPEQRFILSIHQKDQAFGLKNEGKGWGLYDGQGQPLKIAAEAHNIGKPLFTGAKKDDPFSRLMAALVRDTAVMYNTYVLEQPLTDSSLSLTHPLSDSTHYNPSPVTSSTALPSAATQAPATLSLTPSSPASSSTALSPVTPSAPLSPKTPDSSAASLPRDITLSHFSTIRDTSASGFAHPDSSAVPHSSAIRPPYHPSAVVKLSERKSSRALRLVYADHPSDKKADTIVVIIPIDTATPSSAAQATSSATQAPPSAARATSSATTTSSPAVGSPIRTEHPHPLAPSSDTAHSTAPGGHGPNSDSPALSAAASHPKPVLPFVNSDCHDYATDYDVDRLRVKMLEAAKDDDRIQAARKIFKTKCFSTHQIRALSEVFTADASKFKFLEAAYPFVSDAHFPELVNLLTDPVYSGRFRTMTDRH
jgi:hypothetical protein